LAANASPQLVILDWMLPGINGLDVLRGGLGIMDR